MSAALHSLFRQRDGWTNAERALFARIERLLADAGLRVEIEHGQSDEGEPWCVFCAPGSGDVVIHAACIDGRFMIDSPMLPRPIEGRSFERCAERFFEDCRLPMALNDRRDAVLLHPAAMLASLFLTILLYAQAMSEQPLFDADPVDADADGEAPEAAATGLAPRLKLLAQQIADFAQGTDTTAQAAQQQAQAGNSAMAAIPAGMALAAIAIAEDLARAQDYALPDPEADAAATGAGAEAAAAGLQAAAVAPRRAPGEHAPAEGAAEAETATEAAQGEAAEESADGHGDVLALIAAQTVAAADRAGEALADNAAWMGEAVEAVTASLERSLDDAAEMLAGYGLLPEEGSVAADTAAAGPTRVLETPESASDEALFAFVTDMIATVVASAGQVETAGQQVLSAVAEMLEMRWPDAPVSLAGAGEAVEDREDAALLPERAPGSRAPSREDSFDFADTLAPAAEEDLGPQRTAEPRLPPTQAELGLDATDKDSVFAWGESTLDDGSGRPTEDMVHLLADIVTATVLLGGRVESNDATGSVWVYLGDAGESPAVQGKDLAAHVWEMPDADARITLLWADWDTAAVSSIFEEI